MLRIKSMRLKLTHEGFEQILTSAPVVADIEQRTARIAAAAGEGFQYEVQTSGRRHGSSRAVGMVWAATREARLAEANSHVLTAAIGGGR